MSATGTPPPTPAKPFGWRFTTPLLLGSTLNPINSSMIATGLVGIGVDFHLGPGPVATLVSVLYLSSAIAQPTMGKLSSLFGPRRIFQAGLVVLLLAGAAGTLAPNLGFLLASRVLIGIGTSAAYPTAMALVRQRADQMGTGVPSRTLGDFSIAAQVTAVIGLPLGGVLVGVWGWRALFFINIPLALIVFAMTVIGIARDAPLERGVTGSVLAAIDIPGIVLFTGGIAALLVFFSDLRHPTWWLPPLFVALLGALVLWERRVASPLIDVRMLARNAPLQRTYLRQLLIGLGSYAPLYGISEWMEQSAKLSAFITGLILVPFSLVTIVIARIVSTRGWIRWPLWATGASLAAAALVVLFLHHDSPIWLLATVTLLFGVSGGLASFANQAALYIQAPADEIAVASGLYRTFTYMGGIFSSSLIGITFGTIATDQGLHTLAWALLAIGAAITILTVADRRIPPTANRT